MTPDTYRRQAVLMLRIRGPEGKGKKVYVKELLGGHTVDFRSFGGEIPRRFRNFWCSDRSRHKLPLDEEFEAFFGEFPRGNAAWRTLFSLFPQDPNFEVETDHAYRVGTFGTLVHNLSPIPNETPPGGSSAANVQADANVQAEAAKRPVHSEYPDGKRVYEGEQPGKVKGPDPETKGAPHTVVKFDKDGRPYKRRTYKEGGIPDRDVDLTYPTYPSVTRRSNHSAPEQHRHILNIPNNPSNPAGGYKRGKGEPLNPDEYNPR